MRNAVRNILRKGYRPVIAHVERYAELYKKPDFVMELREYGALFQVNASSVVKIRFGKVASFIKSLFKRSYVDVIATDAHSTEVYTPIMSEAAKKIARSYGDDVAKKVCLTNPLAIINGIKLF
jgi:protein-tyrosine phosphatase